ncbi:MAG: hemolysin III family protein [Candidatus Woesearchaeota archaeon]
MKIKDFENNEKHTGLEEIANSITHGIGTILAIAGLILLIIFSSNKGIVAIISTLVYGITLIFLYLSSTLYHAIQHKKTKYIFEILDHIGIYLLIAGTYTPFTLLVIGSVKGWILLSIIWTFAILGIILKPFMVKKFLIISTGIYVLMGWMCIFLVKELILKLSEFSLLMLIIGGVLYTAGTFFYVFRKIRFGHMIWHIFVLLASISHFISIFTYVL